MAKDSGRSHGEPRSNALSAYSLGSSAGSEPEITIRHPNNSGLQRDQITHPIFPHPSCARPAFSGRAISFCSKCKEGYRFRRIQTFDFYRLKWRRDLPCRGPHRYSGDGLRLVSGPPNRPANPWVAASRAKGRRCSMPRRHEADLGNVRMKLAKCAKAAPALTKCHNYCANKTCRGRVRLQML